MPMGITESILDDLPPEASEDLAHLAENSDKLPEIARVVANSQLGVGFTDCVAHVANETAIPKSDVNRILWSIWNLYRLKDRGNLETREFLRQLADRESRIGQGAALAIGQEKVDAISEFVDQLSETHPLVIARKAERLAVARQNIFSYARLVTDVRPVFDRQGENVVESFVMHTLLVDFLEGTQPQRIEFALDAEDVTQLKRLCERAECKAATLKTKLKEAVSWTNVVLGEENSETT